MSFPFFPGVHQTVLELGMSEHMTFKRKKSHPCQGLLTKLFTDEVFFFFLIVIASNCPPLKAIHLCICAFLGKEYLGELVVSLH